MVRNGSGWPPASTRKSMAPSGPPAGQATKGGASGSAADGFGCSGPESGTVFCARAKQPTKKPSIATRKAMLYLVYPLDLQRQSREPLQDRLVARPQDVLNFLFLKEFLAEHFLGNHIAGTAGGTYEGRIKEF